MQISQYIGDLLYRYECVTVPGFGAFLSHPISARVDIVSNDFYPPQKQLSFNIQLQSNDGLLTSYISEVEKIKADLSKKDNEKKKEATQISEQINGKEYSTKKLSTENNELYWSVKPTEIAKLIQEENKIDIKPLMIQPIEEIKALGKFKVKVSLHSEVDAEITINVSSADTIQ